MTSFAIQQSPINPHTYLIHNYRIGWSTFHTNEQGIHLIKKVLFEGPVNLLDRLPAGHPSGMILEGALKVYRGILSGSQDYLSADYFAKLEIIAPGWHEILATIEFRWVLGVYISVDNVTFTSNESILNQFMCDSGLTAHQKVTKMIQLWNELAPNYLSQLLWYTECRGAPVVPVEAVIPHIKTEWDVLD